MMTAEELRLLLSQPEQIPSRAFAIARDISILCHDEDTLSEGREMVIRALEHYELFQSLNGALDALAGQVGLFPYVDPQKLNVAGQLAYEFHRPLDMELDDREIVFHKEQGDVYRGLMDGQSYVLSAPTSFGKSLIIDALLASGKFNNVVIIVDERRLCGKRHSLGPWRLPSEAARVHHCFRRRSIMNLPAEFQPTTITAVLLSDGRTIDVPTCEPLLPPWTGNTPAFTFGGKPLVEHDGTACFAELAILRKFPPPWKGAWTAAFGGLRLWRTMPASWSAPSDANIAAGRLNLLEQIWKRAGQRGCLDLYVYNPTDYLFVEAKHKGKDKLTKSEIRFFEAALGCGVPLDRLLIAEWSFA